VIGVAFWVTNIYAKVLTGHELMNISVPLIQYQRLRGWVGWVWLEFLQAVRSVV
jgi:hypothetical protein